MLDRYRKDIIELFRREGLSITCETYLSVTDYLDVTFNMETGKYTPFRKDNNTPLYINVKSNHPTTVKKEIPKMVESRLSKLSSDEEIFNRAKGIYQTALQESGHAPDMEFHPQVEELVNPTGRNRKRNRKVVWYNPPFSSHVKTDVGKKFLQLLDAHSAEPLSIK